MKKLLFTLCAVLAGFAANADNQLTAKYVYNNADVENNEITVTPGQTAQIYVSVNDMEGVVEGFQAQWFVKDVAGNVYEYPASTAYTPETAPKVYFKLNNSGKNPFSWYGMSNLTGINGMAQSTPGDGTYRIIAASTAVGAVWIGSTAEACEFFGYDDFEELADEYGYTEAMFTQGNVLRFQVVTTEDWAEEYATVDFDQEYDKLQWHGAAATKLGLPDLKIKNANYQAPLEDLTGEVEFAVDEETGKVTVNYTGDEDVTITVKVDGEVVEFPYQLEDGVATTFEYTVEAEGYNPLTDSETLTWNAPTPDQTEAPVITHEASNGTVTVTATGEGTVILNGPNNVSVTGNGTATAEVTYDPYDGYNGTWTATAQAEGELVSETTVYPIAIGAEVPTVATPVITFNETKDGEVVTAVAVDIVNYTEYTIKVNGEPYTAKTEVASFTANYTEDQVIEVTAKNAPIANHPEFAETAEGEYTLKKLEKKEVAAPEVTPTTGDDAVTLNITWPESDGDHVIMVNGEDSDQTSFPRQDEAYDVELDIYVTEGPTSAESTHYTETITIPAKEPVTPTEETGQPAFNPWTYKPNQNAAFITIDNAETESNATIYYRIFNPDGSIQGATEDNPEGWQVYNGEIGIYGANAGGMDGNYRIEAYAQAPGKLPSKVIATEKVIDEETIVNELIAGKTIANVRYFNMAGQEMQEANGMTIVVTTYTDGTTSAIKVMK